jgi:hypothetical protein
MTLNELIERLQDMRERLSGGDVEVLVVHQPGYPLQEVIAGVWMPEDDQSGSCGKCGRLLDDGECPECGWTPDDGKGKEHFVYVVASGHHHKASPYGPRRAFDEAC